ncbi:1-phosphofructokinase [Candidatus Magnetoovum chiemensis]|nr:1-phosphofructokinase [Candidatus Magnetoovum chiemensis]
MILTVTLNASIDKLLFADNFTVNSVLRAEAVMESAGGKGINVSRAIKHLRGTSTALTLLGGGAGALIARKLEDEGIAYRFVEIEDSSRTCYALIDRVNKTETVINESGPTVTSYEIERFCALFKDALNKASIVVFSGSAARGFDSAIYNNLIVMAKQRGCLTIVDASAQLLERAIEASPHIVKINKAEFNNLIGAGVSTDDSGGDLVTNMRRLQARGVDNIVITDGGDRITALVSDRLIKDGLIIVQPPRINDVLNTWGCGDCVTGAIAYGLDRGMSFVEVLSLAAAAGAANTFSYGAAFFNPLDVDELLHDVKAELDAG